MKRSILFLGLVAILFAFNSCKKCKNEDPTAIIFNSGTENVSVQIQTTGGNTVNINNIGPTEQSEEQTFAPGTVDFTVSIGNNSPIVETVSMEECWNYEVVVNTDNSVVTSAFDKNDK